MQCDKLKFSMMHCLKTYMKQFCDCYYLIKVDVAGLWDKFISKAVTLFCKCVRL